MTTKSSKKFFTNVIYKKDFPKKSVTATRMFKID